MPDNLQDRGAQDRSRINVNEPHELRYWTSRLGVSEAALKQAVAEVGVSVDAVAKQLGKHLTDLVPHVQTRRRTKQAPGQMDGAFAGDPRHRRGSARAVLGRSGRRAILRNALS